MRRRYGRGAQHRPFRAIGWWIAAERSARLSWPSRLIVSLTVLTLIAVGLTSCGDPTIKSQPSSIPPKVTMASIGMPHEFKVTSDSSTGFAHRRARSDTSTFILAQATDKISGVKSAHIEASADTVCTGTPSGTGAPTPVLHEKKDLSKTTNAAPDAEQTGHAPSQLEVVSGFTMKDLLACPTSYSWTMVTISLVASAENFSNLRAQTAPVVIRHEADIQNDEFLRVGVFNIADDIIGYCETVAKIPVYCPFTDQQRTDILTRWGQTLVRQADVVLLAEIKGSDQLKTLAQGAGPDYQYWTAPGWDPLIGGDFTYANVGVISRCPIPSSASYFVPEGYASANKVADVTLYCPGPQPRPTRALGLPLRFLANHWHDTSVDAKAIVSHIKGYTEPVFVGGDLNAGTGTPAIDTLSSALTDAFATVQHDPSAKFQPCEPNPGDRIFYSGGYVAYQYKDDCIGRNRIKAGDPEPPDCVEVCPSDHPFVLVSFELGF